MASTTLRPVTELACDRDEEPTSFAAPAAVYLHGDARFRAWKDATGRVFVDVRDARYNTLLTVALDDAALGNLLTAIAGTKPDVKIQARNVGSV